jgi:hypothetical protein
MDMATVEDSIALIRELKIATHVTHEKSQTSSATTEWNVNWDEVLIARDIMQNFYDANRHRVEDIDITVRDGTVQISAPTSYNLERLFYLGSEKGPEDVGQYGEGFKVAATCLLRDHRVTPIACCESQILCLRIAEEPVAGTQLYPLVYDFFTSDTTVEGTRLILPHCSKKMVRELQKGLHHFLYEGNPLLGRKLWSNYRDDFAIYASTDAVGHVFYKDLMRGEIEGIPVVLVIKKEFKSIENKIKSDRDRKAFGGDLMELFYRTFVRSALAYGSDGMLVLVEAARPCWVRGHPLLSEIAKNAKHWRNPVFDQKVATSIFGDGYFARSHSQDSVEQMRYDELERRWTEQGRQALPAYFVRLGVLSAERHYEKLEEQAKKESLGRNAHPPTPAESESIQVLRSILRDLSPEMVGLFDERRTTYTVAETETLLGELRKGRNYRSHDVFLAADVFLADFPDAVAIFLHEHSHIFGYDGSRGFSDALTELLATVIGHRKALDEYEPRWLAVRDRVKAERKKRGRNRSGSDVEKRLAAMSKEDLRGVVARVPRVLLKRLLDGDEDK